MDASRSPLDDHRARWPGLSDDERVRSIAARIVRDLEIEAAPVPLRMVASHLDIRDIDEVDDLSEAGCLIVGPNGAKVRLRASDSHQRKRFTIGHECGHTFHAHYGDAPRYRCNPLAKTADEIERGCATSLRVRCYCRDGS